MRRFTASGNLTRALLVTFLLATAAAMGTGPAGAAAPANVSVAFTVGSHSQVTPCAPGPATQFGVVLPGTVAAPNADCTVTFGSSNDSSMLHAYQSDAIGSAMYRMTTGTLDQNWDASVAGNGQFTVTGGITLGWEQTRPTTRLQPGTNLLVTSYLRSSDAINVVRFEEDGDLDPTFGTLGRYSNTSYNWAHGNAMTVGPDGSIYIASRDGWFPYDFVLLKLTPNGALDTSFDGPTGSGNGIVAYTTAEQNLPQTVQPNGIMVMPDGDLFVYGTSNNGNYIGVGMRFTSNGNFDTSFSGDGSQIYDLGSHTHFENAVLEPSGSVIAVGWEWSGDQDFVIARILADGSTDPAFDGPAVGYGSNGLFSVTGPGGAELAFGVGIASDGDVIVGGETDLGGGDAFVMRLNGTTGAFDTAWDGPTGTGNGRVRYTTAGNADGVYEVLVAPTGEIYYAGFSTPGGVGSEPTLWRVGEDGTLDTTFDGASGTSNGKVVISGSATDDHVWHAIAGIDGDIILSGTTDAATDVLRMTRFDGGPYNDYDDDDLPPADENWLEGTGFFGVCLRAFTGTSPTPSWSVHATCAQDDTGTHWRPVPKPGTAAKVGQVGTGALDGSASFRFAAKVPNQQAPGRYVAPITFEVIAPAT